MGAGQGLSGGRVGLSRGAWGLSGGWPGAGQGPTPMGDKGGKHGLQQRVAITWPCLSKPFVLVLLVPHAEFMLNAPSPPNWTLRLQAKRTQATPNAPKTRPSTPDPLGGGYVFPISPFPIHWEGLRGSDSSDPFVSGPPPPLDASGRSMPEPLGGA